MPYEGHTLSSHQFILDQVDHKLEHRGSLGEKAIKQLILNEAEKYQLSEDAVKGLANELDIPFIPRPRIHNDKYSGWIPSICKKFEAIKYENPSEPEEYIVMVHKYNMGSVDYLEHSPNGHQRLSWISDLLSSSGVVLKPSASIISPNDFQGMQQSLLGSLANADPQFASIHRGRYSKHINTPFIRTYHHIDPYIIRAIHAFFDTYVPELDGICPRCFQAQFADGGQGISYTKCVDAHTSVEVRVSGAKSHKPGDPYMPAQHRVYVTNIVKVHGQKLFLEWTPNSPSPLNLQPVGLTLNHEAYHSVYFSHDQSVINRLLRGQSVEAEIRKILKLDKNKVVELALCNCK